MSYKQTSPVSFGSPGGRSGAWKIGCLCCALQRDTFDSRPFVFEMNLKVKFVDCKLTSVMGKNGSFSVSFIGFSCTTERAASHASSEWSVSMRRFQSI